MNDLTLPVHVSAKGPIYTNAFGEHKIPPEILVQGLFSKALQDWMKEIDNVYP